MGYLRYPCYHAVLVLTKLSKSKIEVVPKV